jgi:lipopolysaccharide/colanic/teichoic acid biosynthesis glycosyltransferase|tara:strand:- start:8682 stop:9344 length:663 start_codon:yes stop_codon:yes gene_type:complete
MLIRFFDILFSLLALFFLLPLFVPIVIILRFTGEKEIFYRQERVGQFGSTFNLLKFATMLKNSPTIGAGEITLKNDPRVLPFGRFLRKSKINELPQLINILLGQISIVGPRPMVPGTFNKYSLEARSELNKVKPGLTGMGSIIFRDEEKFLEGKKNPKKFYDECIIPYKNKIELWYIKNQSIITYFKIIFVTAWVIIFSKSRIIEKFFSDIPVLPPSLKA